MASDLVTVLVMAGVFAAYLVLFVAKTESLQKRLNGERSLFEPLDQASVAISFVIEIAAIVILLVFGDQWVVMFPTAFLVVTLHNVIQKKTGGRLGLLDYLAFVVLGMTWAGLKIAAFLTRNAGWSSRLNAAWLRFTAKFNGKE